MSEADKGSAAKPKAKAKAKAASTKKVTKKEAPTSKKRTPPAGGPTAIPLSDFWSDAPRITSKATNPQLSHELLKRDPLATGLSGKPKSWFVSKLGENSVWTTNEGMKQHTDKLFKAPLVTNSLTKGQLMHEIMTRTPGIKGLSSKSKDDLLSMVAVGSIWTTGPMTTTTTATDVNATSKPPPAKRAKIEKKKTPKQSQTKSTPIHAYSKTVAPSASGVSSSAPLVAKVQVHHPVQAKPAASPKRVIVVKAKPQAVGLKQSARRTGGKPIGPNRKDPGLLDTSLAPKRVAPSKVIHLSPSSASLPRASSPTTQEDMDPVQIFTSSSDDISVSSYSSRPPIFKSCKFAARKIAAAKKNISTISKSMTIPMLIDEMKYRNPRVTALSGKSKSWLIAELGDGSPLLGYTADAEAKTLHVETVSFVSRPLADSSLLRAPRHYGPHENRKRVHVARCDVNHPLVCSKRPYRSSEPLDYDICKACFDIESLPEHDRKKKLAEIDNRKQEIDLKRQHQREMQRREVEKQHRVEALRWRKVQEERERERDLAHKKDLLRFTANIKKPSKTHTNVNSKKKFTVWTKDTHPSRDIRERPEFDSSFESLKDANLRVEYLFYYANPWEEEKDDVYTKEDELQNNRFRYLMTDNDNGQTYTVSAMPSGDFVALTSLQHFHGGCPGWSREYELEDYLRQDSFPINIRKPSKQSLSANKKLQYTVWTSCGYDNHGSWSRWHRQSSGDTPDKVFNSSFKSLEQANQRAEFVFYYDNPWGFGLDEMGPAETDDTTSTGLRYLECQPDDSQRWTVSVVPSSAFPFMHSF